MMLPATDRDLRNILEAGVALAGARARRTRCRSSTRAGPAPWRARCRSRMLVRNAAFEPQRGRHGRGAGHRPGRPNGDAACDARGGAEDGRPICRASFVRRLPAFFESPPTCVAASALLGTATTSVLVGGADLEMTDPRLNVQLLQRLAPRLAAACSTEDRLSGASGPAQSRCRPRRRWSSGRDLWHTGWSFAAILMLLGAEWMLATAVGSAMNEPRNGCVCRTRSVGDRGAASSRDRGRGRLATATRSSCRARAAERSTRNSTRRGRGICRPSSPIG